MNPVSAVSAYAKTNGAKPLSAEDVAKPVGGKDGSFGKLINDFVANTNEAQVASDEAVKNLASGNTDNIQQVVLAVANAEMSFQLFMEIRNKLIDSYNELMRMQF